jgi:murein DD-endopeptidase MepM/ murein hydrolase activator NlpD
VIGVLASSSGIATTLLRIFAVEVMFAAVLFALVLGLTRLLRNAAPALRHALWGLVLLRLVLPIDLATPYSLGSLAPDGLAVSVSESPVISHRSQPLAAIGPGAELGGVASEAANRFSWSALLVGVWAVGVVGVGAVAVRRRRRYRRVVERATPIRDDRVTSALSQWRREFRIRRHVTVVTSEALHSPFTLGAFRPVVFLPRLVLEHDDRRVLESVIAHELAHVKRWDDLLLNLQLCITALYFFNPIAWLSAGRMREESERACDELVISRGGISPRIYGRSIVTVLRLGLSCEPVVTPALGNPLKKQRARLETIMKTKLGTTNKLRRLYPLPVALACGLFLLPMANGAQRENGPQEIEEQEQRTAVERQDAVVMSNPLPGSRVSSPFGRTSDPFTDEQRHHNGIDLVGAPDAEVLAPADGIVEEATTDYHRGEAFGTVIILNHGNGVKTMYSHLGRLVVERGQRVRRGGVIGIQGVTGKTTGPHVHFEVWVEGEPRDPALFVAEWQSARGY